VPNEIGGYEMQQEKQKTLKSETSRIERASRQALQEEWFHLFGQRPPHRCSLDILRGNLLLNVREKYGECLSDDDKKSLRRTYAQFKKSPHYRPHAYTPDIKPGTKFVREWRGDVFEVMVLDKGYEFQGRLYTSLSEITRLITGTRWNGKKFFGVR
jgi:hypothetical protein